MERLCDELERRGHACWMAPRDISPGSDWTEAILGAVERCALLILLDSEASRLSRHVRRELEHARRKGRRTLLVPSVDSSEPEDWLVLAVERAEAELSKRSRRRRALRLAAVAAAIPVALLLLLGTVEGTSPKVPGEMTFVSVPGGSFVMGLEPEDTVGTRTGYDSFSGQLPSVSVSVGSFEMLQTEVTQGMWADMTGDGELGPIVEWERRSGLSVPRGDSMPMLCVSWREAVEAARTLSRVDPEHDYRLPSEAEWEYACRAGADGWRPDGLDSLSWHNVTCDRPMRVAMLEPNPLGLYDMLGNAGEWCADVWSGSHAGASPDGTPRTSGRAGYRVVRGACWASAPLLHTYTFRVGEPEDNGRPEYGFRLVRVPEEGEDG